MIGENIEKKRMKTLSINKKRIPALTGKSVRNGEKKVAPRGNSSFSGHLFFRNKVIL